MDKPNKRERQEEWLTLIDLMLHAETEEEFQEIEETTSIPEIKDAISEIRKINAEENVYTRNENQND